MTLQLSSQSNADTWNSRITANADGGNVFQSFQFAMLKQRGGWKPRFAEDNSTAITILERAVPLLGKLWYIPKGPGVASLRELDDLLPQIRLLAEKNGVFAVKIEPELIKTPETTANLLKMNLVKAPNIQPNASTVLINLSPSLDEIIASLNQKGRHAIRRAERDGVTVKRVEATDENCQQMFQLLALTAEGNFRLRHYSYYKAFWQTYQNAGLGQLFFAYVDGAVVASAFALVFGTKSTYKDGASVRERPAYGASHLLQWEVMKWAKEKGSLVHDLCGTPPSDKINDTSHPHYGIGRFKTSFNKQVTDYIGVYDLPIHRKRYTVWRKIGERAVTRLHSKRHHENYY